jgi:hypothetical protein
MYCHGSIHIDFGKSRPSKWLAFKCSPTRMKNVNHVTGSVVTRLLVLSLVTALPESGTLPSAQRFAECFLSGTRQSPALGNDGFCREQDSRHSKTLGKDFFAESQTLGEVPHSTNGCQPPCKADDHWLCRESSYSTWQRIFFAECPPFDTRQSKLCRVLALDTRQSIFLFFYFTNQTLCGMFLHYVDLHVPF